MNHKRQHALLPVTEVAAFLHISRSAVYARLNRGTLRGVIGADGWLVPLKDVMAAKKRQGRVSC